jgi:hypothetical protein
VRGRGLAGLVAAPLAAVTLLGGLVAGGASGATVPNLPWTELLPPLPSPSQTERVKVKHCRVASMKCVRVQIRRMKRLRARLGCDHRAVFTTTYLELTREAKRTLKRDPGFFDQPKFFFREDALFANFYFDVIKAQDRGEPVPEAWKVAFQTAATGDVNAAQDMLLGINAHVQNDMPFVLAALALRNKQGESRKPDHDRFNQVLNRAYEPVIQEINRRYDPIVSLLTASWHPIDDVAGLEVVRGWRELVWRNAERLVNAQSDAARGRIAREIEQLAGLQARLIALVPQPGYGATRDAYCEQQLAG